MFLPNKAEHGHESPKLMEVVDFINRNTPRVRSISNDSPRKKRNFLTGVRNEVYIIYLYTLKNKQKFMQVKEIHVQEINILTEE